jgi:hypothetical protein
MVKDQSKTQANRLARAKKLSPELNELLQMLEALEDQMGKTQTPSS